MEEFPRPIPQRGCFNTIRMLLALKVMLFHAIWHLGINIDSDVRDTLFPVKATPVFFMISGFLIWGSLGRSKDFYEYLKKRFWRIYPELWCGIIVGLSVLLILYDESVDWTQIVGFAFAQGTFFQFWTPDCLRGYGCGVPNGSLWTIGILIQFYLIAYFLYRYLRGQKKWVWLTVFVTCLAMGVLIPVVRQYLPVLPGKLLSQMIFPYLWCFVFASFVAEKKDWFLPYMKKYWWLALVLFLIVCKTGYDIRASYYMLQTIMLFLSLIGIAYTFPKMDLKTDLSYGIYIYHMIVVNALLALGYKHEPWLLLVVMTLTGLAAYFSTKTIGKVARRMLEHNNNRTYE